MRHFWSIFYKRIWSQPRLIFCDLLLFSNFIAWKTYIDLTKWPLTKWFLCKCSDEGRNPPYTWIKRHIYRCIHVYFHGCLFNEHSILFQLNILEIPLNCQLVQISNSSSFFIVHAPSVSRYLFQLCCLYSYDCWDEFLSLEDHIHLRETTLSTMVWALVNRCVANRKSQCFFSLGNTSRKSTKYIQSAQNLPFENCQVIP